MVMGNRAVRESPRPRALIPSTGPVIFTVAPGSRRTPSRARSTATFLTYEPGVTVPVTMATGVPSTEPAHFLTQTVKALCFAPRDIRTVALPGETPRTSMAFPSPVTTAVATDPATRTVSGPVAVPFTGTSLPSPTGTDRSVIRAPTVALPANFAAVVFTAAALPRLVFKFAAQTRATASGCCLRSRASSAVAIISTPPPAYTAQEPSVRARTVISAGESPSAMSERSRAAAVSARSAAEREPLAARNAVISLPSTSSRAPPEAGTTLTSGALTAGSPSRAQAAARTTIKQGLIAGLERGRGAGMVSGARRRFNRGAALRYIGPGPRTRQSVGCWNRPLSNASRAEPLLARRLPREKAERRIHRPFAVQEQGRVVERRPREPSSHLVQRAEHRGEHAVVISLAVDAADLVQPGREVMPRHVR